MARSGVAIPYSILSVCKPAKITRKATRHSTGLCNNRRGPALVRRPPPAIICTSHPPDRLGSTKWSAGSPKSRANGYDAVLFAACGNSFEPFKTTSGSTIERHARSSGRPGPARSSARLETIKRFQKRETRSAMARMARSGWSCRTHCSGERTLNMSDYQNGHHTLFAKPSSAA